LNPKNNICPLDWKNIKGNVKSVVANKDRDIRANTRTMEMFIIANHHRKRRQGFGWVNLKMKQYGVV
jgi:hypothetical protein